MWIELLIRVHIGDSLKGELSLESESRVSVSKRLRMVRFIKPRIISVRVQGINRLVIKVLLRANKSLLFDLDFNFRPIIVHHC